jgi:hypothetical protein
VDRGSKVRKPWLVRVAGWLFWVGLLWICFVLWAATQVRGTALLLFGLWVYGAFTLGCLGVSLLGSLADWVVRKQGRQQAAILRDSLEHRFRGKAAQAPAEPLATGGLVERPVQAKCGHAPAAPLNPVANCAALASLRCDVCGARAGVFFCTVHGAPVCVAHLAGHDTPVCVYVPSARVTVLASPPTAT